MSNGKQTDEKDGQKSEKQFLTLADKKPSLIRATGTQSVSPGGIDGSLDDITNRKRKRGNLSEFGSGKFSDGNPNDQGLECSGAFNNGMFKTESSQGKKHNLGSDMSSNEYLKRFGRGKFSNKENDKRFKSQNPKKDGPLSTRIFIDAFLPSLEGNRIFPLFNYRCSEKIERTSKDFKQRNSKRLNKQLVAVSSTEANGDGTVQSTAEKILNVKEYRNEGGIKIVNEAQNAEEMEQRYKLGKSQEIRHKIESQEVVEVHHLQRIEELHGAKEIHEVLVVANVDGADQQLQEGRTDAKLIEANYEAKEHLQLKSELSNEEESLLQKLLRILKENEELVDFFCEKVISKIALRNDFCGPNCKGMCGGLNKPSKAE